MFCGKCGTNNPDGMAFCSACGAPLGQQGAAQPEAPAQPVAPAQPEAPAAAPVQPEAPAQPTVQVVPEQQPAMNQQFQQPGMNQFGQQPGMNQFGQQPFNQQPPYGQGVSPLMGQTPNDKKNSKTALIVAIVLVVLLAAAACVVFFVWKPFGGKGGNGSPTAAVQGFCDAVLKGKAKEIKKYCPPYMEADIDEDDLKDIAEGMEMVKSMGMKISIKAKDYEAYDDDDFNDLCDEIEYRYDYDADKIQDAGEVTVEMNMKGEMFGEKYDESDEEEVVVVKIGGKWYIHDFASAF
jgi:hypothetical protein